MWMCVCLCVCECWHRNWHGFRGICQPPRCTMAFVGTGPLHQTSVIFYARYQDPIKEKMCVCVCVCVMKEEHGLKLSNWERRVKERERKRNWLITGGRKRKKLESGKRNKSGTKGLLWKRKQLGRSEVWERQNTHTHTHTHTIPMCHAIHHLLHVPTHGRIRRWYSHMAQILAVCAAGFLTTEYITLMHRYS